jgi:hypothetical protein
VHAEFHELENTRDWIYNNLAMTKSLQELRMHKTTTGRGNCKSLEFCCELREPQGASLVLPFRVFHPTFSSAVSSRLPELDHLRSHDACLLDDAECGLASLLMTRNDSVVASLLLGIPSQSILCSDHNSGRPSELGRWGNKNHLAHRAHVR